MAHNLAVIDGRVAMAYQGATPWHKLGQRLTGQTSLQAALQAAGLDYTVALEPLYLGDGRTVDTHRSVVRVVPGGVSVPLGVVGDTYTAVQNSAAAEPLQALMDLGCTVAAAGALGQGERCWCLIQLPADTTVQAVPGDDNRGYFLLHWSHDASTGVNGRLTVIRVVCQNTLSAATASGRDQFSIRHTTSAARRLDEAASLLKSLMAAMRETGDTFAALAAKRLSPQALAAYIEAVVPNTDPKATTIAPVIQSRRDTIARLIHLGQGADLANQLIDTTGGAASAWAAYNAITEYFDHVRPGEAKSPEGVARANESALFGGNALIKVQALKIARQLIAA